MSGNLAGHVCIVTGATGGLGKATARELARAGASVVMACRDVARGGAARAEIAGETGNDALELMEVDLASQRSVREMAGRFKAKHERLDLLVNNAAVMLTRRLVSADGLEMMFTTNHLGPFLLTNLLRDELTSSGRGQVINVTAPSTVELDFNDLQGEKKFRALRAFGASKMCNLLFTYELARRLADSGVTVNAFHPGLMRSNLLKDAPALMRWMSWLVSSSPERGARELVWLVSAQEAGGASGKFFKGKKIIESNAYSHNQDVQRRLWAVSSQIAGLEQREYVQSGWNESL